MEQTKQRLTSLIDRINKQFPDGPDLKGFPGISRAMITDSLVQSDTLLVTLKDHPEDFDIIILKRELAEQFEKIDETLNEPFDKIGDKKFNSLLRALSRLRLLIRDSYFSMVNEQPIRTEAQVAKSKEELDALKSTVESIRTLSGEVTARKTQALESIAQIENDAKAKGTTFEGIVAQATDDVNNSKTTLTTKIEEFVGKVESTESAASNILEDLNASLKEIEASELKVKASNENVTQWKSDIQNVKTDLEKYSKEYSELNSKSKSVQTEIETTYGKISGAKDAEGKVTKKGYLQEIEDLKSQVSKFLTDQTTKYNTQFTQIEGLLPGATSAGLAEAYQKQKESYTGPMRLWSWIFIITMVGMAGLSVYLLIGQLQSTKEPSLNDALIALLRELPFFIPTIWLAAYASKQQSQYKRLQQEYAFKETNAKSFHGHKVQIEELLENGETDAQLLSQLVAQLVLITSQNPSITLDSNLHEDSPPMFKLIDKYMPSFKKGSSAENPDK
jgi:hypothetical protein